MNDPDQIEVLRAVIAGMEERLTIAETDADSLFIVMRADHCPACRTAMEHHVEALAARLS
jgi:hypothetical protein